VLYKARRAYKVQLSGRQSSWSGRSRFIYRNCMHQFNRPDISHQGPAAPKPYYGNYVQPKCNRSDTGVTPSERMLVMEAFNATLDRRLQLTVRTLCQAVRTPSGILVITFYSNIGLGRNRCRWKANKIFYKLMVRTAIILIRTETSCVRMALRKFQNYFSDKEKVARPDGQGSRPDARARDSVFDLI
jgi:hypothetical protein